ncbi:hypothetical protein SprV_0100475400 [Sparganum proliferum]
MLALVDTGANVSLVNSSSLTLELHEQIDHTSGPHILRAPNGALIPVLGRITLVLIIENTEVTYPFLVTSDSLWALVLGLDLLADYDCVIHTKSRRMSILTRPDPPTHTPSENRDLIYDAMVAAATLEPSDIDANLSPAEAVGSENRDKLRCIAALLDRLQQIRTWPKPVNQTQLRSFLGLASYYRRFIRNFAYIAGPLHKLKEKGREFKWSPECEEAFTNLRAALVSTPLLALPNADHDVPPVILDTDASGFVTGTILSQTDSQGVEHPPGHKHGSADALSRLPDSPPNESETHTASVNAISMSETTRHTWAEAQRTEPDTATIYHHLTNNLNKLLEADMRGSSQNARILLHQWPHLLVDNDTLFLQNPASKRLCPVVPGCLIEPVLADLHAELGHCGQKRTELAARARF